MAILRGGKVIDFNTDADDLAELGAGAHGAGFNSFALDAIAREKGKRADGEKSNEHQTADDELVRLEESSWKHRCPPFDGRESENRRGRGATERADMGEKSWLGGAFGRERL